MPASAGADVFLSAAAELARARPDIRFRMIGGITEPLSAFAAAWPGLVRASGLGSAVHLAGHLSAIEVIRDVRQASVVVLPSRIDEFSRAALECLTLEVPIVTTSGVGAAYLAERDGSGLVVPPGDSAALARAIGRVLSEERFAREAQTHADSLRGEFSAAALAARWVPPLQNATRDRPGSAAG
jgi:glycosyltransferase involved in cell wall biosynthesis